MIKKGFLSTSKKNQCVGCQACKNVCPNDAINMIKDEEGFLYPQINNNKCVNCGLCHKTCQEEKGISFYEGKQYAYGGYSTDDTIRMSSSSGGVFSVIANKCVDEGYVVYGAEGDGINVYHSGTNNKSHLEKYRKSKYTQSDIRYSYREIKQLLLENKKVLFSGTPCQVGALYLFLETLNIDSKNLLTIEVICEGVPSPIYIKKYINYLEQKYDASFKSIDHKSKTTNNKKIGKWDFQVEKVTLLNKKGKTIELYKDRWLNPFWYIWLNHLMSRPSCYECKYTKSNRVADITLGDLWGVHLYCPELYGKNRGASLVICNSDKGKEMFNRIKSDIYGHELSMNAVVKYQGPLRKSIDYNPDREKFILDLMNDTSYKTIIHKYYKKPSLKLLFKKYIYGNRQKIFFWNVFHYSKKVKMPK